MWMHKLSWYHNDLHTQRDETDPSQCSKILANILVTTKKWINFQTDDLPTILVTQPSLVIISC